MKKILILVNHDVVIYNFRRELVEQLLEEGYEVIISSPYGERIKKLIKMGCSFHEIDIERHGINPLKELKLLYNYLKLIKKVKPDMVLTYTIKPNIYGGFIAKILRIPYVANITGLGTAVENSGVLQKISIFLYKNSFSKARKVFFQNQENFDFFIDNKISNSITYELIPGSGVNIEQFSYIEYPEDLSVEFVFISRIMKEKGIDQYIEAAKFIKNKYPNTKFHVCGFCEEDYEDVLNDLQNKDIIRYHGMLNDVREILSVTHCTIHPTYYPEGISNVLLESASSGRPIITTNRSGCREVVDIGMNGFLIEQKNTNDLIKKIEMFLSLTYNQRIEMGISGRYKVEKEFDRKTVVNAYMNIIRLST